MNGPLKEWMSAASQRGVARLDHAIGGPARRHIVVVLACVLALDSADKAAVGAAATQLQDALNIGKTDIGLLIAISSAVGAVATIPAGVLVDRVRRVRLLAGAVVLWGVALAFAGAATSFEFLMLSRLSLGVVTALAGPAAASLIGDWFPAAERGRIYGYVLAGELIGTAFGFMVSGNLASISWRASFFVLVIPAFGVAWLLHGLPEPERGGRGELRVGATDFDGDGNLERTRSGAGDAGQGPERDIARQQTDKQDVQPHDKLVLHSDPARISLWAAIKHVLAIRTNVVLIVASALSYFFFTGVRGFAVEFTKDNYNVGQGLATLFVPVLGIGGLIGVLFGGRIGDRLLRRGHLTGRVVVAGVCVTAMVPLMLPALLTSSVLIALPLFTAASALLGASNPPLDAARLDIMPSGLWGRAESIRTLLRDAAEAAAPLLFGFLAEHAFGEPNGLKYTFLLALLPLLAAGVVTLRYARRTYPRDVATAAASARAARA